MHWLVNDFGFSFFNQERNGLKIRKSRKIKGNMTNRFISKYDILNLKKVQEDEMKFCFI